MVSVTVTDTLCGTMTDTVTVTLKIFHFFSFSIKQNRKFNPYTVCDFSHTELSFDGSGKKLACEVYKGVVMDKSKFNQFIRETVALGKKPQKEPMKKLSYRDVEPYLIKIARKNGIDLNDVIHVITDEFILKQEGHHGDAVHEKNRGNASYSSDDLKKIPSMTESPDILLTGIKREGQNPDHIAYVQNENNGSHIFIERFFPDKKELRSTSFYNRPMQTTKEKLLKILGVNKKTDLSKSIISEKNEINKAGAGGSGSNPD